MDIDTRENNEISYSPNINYYEKYQKNDEEYRQSRRENSQREIHGRYTPERRNYKVIEENSNKQHQLDNKHSHSNIMMIETNKACYIQAIKV